MLSINLFYSEMKEGKPSRTTVVVAKGLVYTYHAHHDLNLVTSETAKWACRFLDQLEKGIWIRWHRLFKYATARHLFRLIEKCGIPRLALHQSIRKHQIATQVKRYLEDGRDMLVVIGVGLDSLALEQCAAGSRETIVELDHPWTQQTKKSVLKIHSSDASALQLIEFDARKQSLHEVFQPLGIVSGGRAVFVCEGVLMHLPEVKVKSLLQEIATTFPDSTLIFTFMDQSRGGSSHFVEATRAARTWLQLIDILDTRDWQAQRMKEHRLPVASGEYIAIAQCQ